MRFSEDFVQRVVEANNLVDFIAAATQLKPSSGGLMGRCPFPDHPEKTPSFSVSESKQVYHCFGCQKSGNLIKFLRDYHGMDKDLFGRSLEKMACDALASGSPQNNPVVPTAEQIVDLYREAW